MRWRDAVSWRQARSVWNRPAHGLLDLHWNGRWWFKRWLLRSSGLALRRPFLPPDSIPLSMASAFVLAAASMTAVSLRSLLFNPNLTTPRANPLQAGGRILLKPSDGIVPSAFSSNHLDNPRRQLASSFARWNVN